jgi:hypothetical protein
MAPAIVAGRFLSEFEVPFAGFTAPSLSAMGGIGLRLEALLPTTMLSLLMTTILC